MFKDVIVCVVEGDFGCVCVVVDVVMVFGWVVVGVYQVFVFEVIMVGGELIEVGFIFLFFFISVLCDIVFQGCLFCWDLVLFFFGKDVVLVGVIIYILQLIDLFWFFEDCL